MTCLIDHESEHNLPANKALIAVLSVDNHEKGGLR
jgi:hypothetical protein